MEKALIVISVLLILIVLLQSNKASDASQIITGGNAMLMGKSKERGAEKLITNVTYALGFAFIIISFILSIN
jgi:preprotein translocase subunit SecG